MAITIEMRWVDDLGSSVPLGNTFFLFQDNTGFWPPVLSGQTDPQGKATLEEVTSSATVTILAENHVIRMIGGQLHSEASLT